MKKGVVEVQFNWILVLIAGALIFGFFFSIVKWGMKGSTDNTAITISKNLDAIFTSAMVTDRTVNEVNLPFNEIAFTCDDYGIDKSTHLESIGNKIVFAPRRIDSGNIVTWSDGWDVPFRVMNFLFVSSPSMKYYVIGSGEVFDFLSENFPEEYTVEFIDTSAGGDYSNVFNQNHFKVRFVFIREVYSGQFDLSEFSDMDSWDVTALYINGGGLDTVLTGVFKKADFFNSEFDTYSDASLESQRLFGEASILGAIFSEDPEDYLCNMEKARARLSEIGKIYKERSFSLGNYYADPTGGDDSNCALIHTEAASDTGPIQVLIDQGGASNPDYQEITDAVYDLANPTGLNAVAQAQSCTLIY